MATLPRTDEDIQLDVLAELEWDTRVGPNEIGVIVKDGVVTLTGWVDSYIKKLAAREAALRVDGVKAVADEIEVRLPGVAARTDADIAAAARQALERDADLPVEHIHSGTVILTGTVRAWAEREEAERVAWRGAGVTKVENHITIKPD